MPWLRVVISSWSSQPDGLAGHFARRFASCKFLRTGITHYRSGLSHEEDQLIPNLYRYDSCPPDSGLLLRGCSMRNLELS